MYVGIFYGSTFRGSGLTPYGSTQWARAFNSQIWKRSIIGEAAFNHVYANAGIVTVNKTAIMANALKYLDHWGNSAFAPSYSWGAFGSGWHPGPSAVGDPSMLVDTAVYGYRMTDRHMARFLGWVEAAMLSTALPCAGVFLDDFLGGRQHWTGAARPRAWGAMNGRLGYNSAGASPYTWNLARTNALLAQLSELLNHVPGKRIICNSGHSALYTGPTRLPGVRWMWEGYQRWHTRTYLRTLMDSGVINAGDVLVVQGRHLAAGPVESWATVVTGNPEVTYGGRANGDNYEDIWADALEDADEFNLDIALGWHPETSGHVALGLDSSFSCLTDPSTLE